MPNSRSSVLDAEFHGGVDGEPEHAGHVALVAHTINVVLVGASKVEDACVQDMDDILVTDSVRCNVIVVNASSLLNLPRRKCWYLHGDIAVIAWDSIEALDGKLAGPTAGERPKPALLGGGPAVHLPETELRLDVPGEFLAVLANDGGAAGRGVVVVDVFASGDVLLQEGIAGTAMAAVLWLAIGGVEEKGFGQRGADVDDLVGVQRAGADDSGEGGEVGEADGEECGGLHLQ